MATGATKLCESPVHYFDLNVLIDLTESSWTYLPLNSIIFALKCIKTTWNPTFEKYNTYRN